ncbi:MAG: PTS glucose transporter subunit IIA [Solobacterium sp.]|nr:PTS glucose transporter subunit IIA [Solobacterium sp.]
MFNFFKKKAPVLEPVNCADNEIVAPADGELIDIATVSDEMFAEQMLGKSIAFKFSGDSADICAPASGELTAIFPTGHAFGITMSNGAELLIHIGIDTVNEQGNGFKVAGKKQGDKVRAGDLIVTVDQKKLSAKYDMSTMVIVTNPNDLEVVFDEPKAVKRGTVVGKIG